MNESELQRIWTQLTVEDESVKELIATDPDLYEIVWTIIGLIYDKLEEEKKGDNGWQTRK